MRCIVISELGTRQRGKPSAKPLADLIGKAMTPACRKRGFASMDLLAAWPDIVGSRYAERVQPERLVWPRTKSAEGEDLGEPATLMVHTDGATALLLSHEIPQIISRINVFFGWAAVGRIKIVQKPVARPAKSGPQPLRDLTRAEHERVERQVATVENPRLREALRKLGEQVIARKTGT